MGGVILNFKKIFNNYFILKIVKALFTIIFVTTLIFFLIRLMPSSPVDIYVQELIMKYDFTIEEARSRAANIFSIELNSPLYVQYINYVKGVLRGDFGKSLLSPGVKVTTIIAKRLPWTLFTVGLGLIISFIVGITIGSLMALNRNKWYEPIITGFASVLSSIPNFLIAIFLIIIFGIVKWGDSTIIPIHLLRGTNSIGVDPGFNLIFIKDILFHGSLLIMTYALAELGAWVLLMKGNTVSILNKDYVMVAKARGLKSRRILYRYVARNAMLPIVTEFAMKMGFIIGGSLIVERLFVYQGLGLELLNAVQARDYPLMQGIFLIITMGIIFSNLLAEFLYGILDPRIRKG